MNDEQSLEGMVVLISPKLLNDPARQRGAVGTVVQAVPAQDDFVVRFKGGVSGLYSSGALLVLKSHEQIYKDVLNSTKELMPFELKALMRMTMLLQSGSKEQMIEAMEIAGLNAELLKRSTEPLSSRIGISAQYQQEANVSLSRSR
ncbi:MAG TPA: hypothetical protein VKB19_12515 [Pedobacter sp.]|nr:hypothetical protein [Pedobacter sp.]